MPRPPALPILPLTPEQVQRFRDKIVPEPFSGCWLWHGAASHLGYGQTCVGPNSQSKRAAHRVAWALQYGEPPANLDVLHVKCDTPLCVNPAHLCLGTHQDNMADCVRKKRNHIPPRKFDEVQAWLAAALSRERVSLEKIGKQLNMSAAAVKEAARRFGIEHPSARVKLSDDDVRHIRRLSSEGLPQRAIAARFDVSCAMVCLIATGKKRKAKC